MRGLAVLAVAALLSGCGNPLAQREAFLDQFVGHPDKELVQKMGVPNRTYETGGVKYLAYVESKVALMPSLPNYGTGPWWANGWNGTALPPQAVELRCETTFTVADGIVKSYTLHGNACG